MRHPLLFAIVLVIAAPFAARVTAQEPPGTGGQHVGIAEAMDHVAGGRWLAAVEAGARAGPVGEDIVLWLWLRAGFGTAEAAMALVARRPDWPGLDRVRRGAESSLPLLPDGPEEAARIVAFFDGGAPATGQGVVSLIDAYRALGRDGDAEAQAALAWTALSMTDAAERRLLDLYPGVLTPLESVRADAMFWNGAGQALSRSGERAEGDAGALIQARLSALQGTSAGRAASDLPAAMRADPGLAYTEFRRLLTAEEYDAAATLLREQSVSAETLGDPSAWARGRRDLARRLMRSGDVDASYAVASSHWLTEGSDYADLEWLSGYLALRRLDRPQDALRHFLRFRKAVFTPISLGRAGYWIGRAHVALGQDAEAQAAYEEGGQWQTSFYGLLAAEAAGMPLDPRLSGTETYPPLSEVSFTDDSRFEAAMLLQAAGARDLAETFLTDLAADLEADEAGTLTDVTLALGEPHLGLLIAKAVARNGIVLPRAYYPVVDLGLDTLPVSHELALSIARRESEFDPVVSSGVGAGGLMQLMPGTAKEVSASLGIGYSRDRLFSDPSYNATLGTAYLAGLERRFGRNPVLVSAGYNAGPGRPLRWMKERGDPRDADVDVIDWIEMIPFDETRNYVMRVAESLPVYRARLGTSRQQIGLTAELKGR
ncbi:lytic transglycosylase domain-containing protein [Palleronia rufa]|uniref:lytic transglycosylase domain-containing protein n=1 Tax=Palleronia rufa TaxID=1530186 RepID=UPI00068F9522|nr:lytic transglycosylase domain-containing protein [Palleronia rufa]